MSPTGPALALLLHALVALALWQMSMAGKRQMPEETPIEVTIERPKPPPKPPEPPTPAKAAPIPLGLPPPAEITADKPTQVPSIPEQPKDALPPHPLFAERALEEVLPKPLPQPALPDPPLARIEPQPQPRDAVPMRRVEPAPSPLSRLQPPRASVATREAPSPSPLINPADVYNRARVSDNYLWQVVRKLAGYRYSAQVSVSQGTTVIRVVIARDGRLLDVSIVRSSGFAQLDQGVVEGVRRGSPYAPLPPEIRGDRAEFTLPLVSTNYER